MPRTAPAADNAIPWPTIKRKTSDGRAPSAIRTPISRVRRATSYESNPYSPIQASKSDFTPQCPKLGVSDDPHDLVACALMADTADTPPERVLILEKAAGKRLVDHSGLPLGVRRQREILRCKHPARHQGNSHGFKEFWSRSKAERLVLGVLCFSFDAKAGIPVIAAQQRIKGISCGNDAWDCLDTLQHLGIETARLCRRVTVERWVHGKEQDVVRIKPGI